MTVVMLLFTEKRHLYYLWLADQVRKVKHIYKHGVQVCMKSAADVSCQRQAAMKEEGTMMKEAKEIGWNNFPTHTKAENVAHGK